MILILISSNYKCKSLSETDDFGLFRSYEVHVINNISTTHDVIIKGDDKLFLQCKSGDDDLGGHILGKGEDLHWNFKVNFWSSTLFYCKMNWGFKKQEFTVFSVGHMTIKCEITRKCFWMVTDDGFYFGCDQKNYTLEYVWN